MTAGEKPEKEITSPAEKKEDVSPMRIYKGSAVKWIALLLCVWTVFQLYFTTLGVLSAIHLRAVHCIFLLVLTFLL